MNDRFRIQNRLKQELEEGPWPLVVYDRQGNPKDPTENNSAKPATILVNETSCQYDTAERNRRDPRRRERVDWSFEAIINFNSGEILFGEFEDRIAAAGILIKSDSSKGERQITLELEGVEYSHPPQKNPQSGSSATFNFRAHVAPY